MIGRKRGGSAASSNSGGADSLKEYKWDRSHSEVGDTLRYFNAFHSSKSWCCVGDEFTPDTISQWIDRDLLVSPEDFEQFKKDHQLVDKSPNAERSKTVERSNLISKCSYKKKSVSILLTMPSTDLDDDVDKTSHLTTFQTSDPIFTSHIRPSKSALKSATSSSYSYLASHHPTCDVIDEVSSPKRRSASLEPHVSFNITTLSNDDNVDAISSVTLDEESNPSSPPTQLVYDVEQRCCHLCGQNGKTNIVKSPTSSISAKSRNFKKWFIGDDRRNSEVESIEDLGSDKFSRPVKSKRRRSSFFGLTRDASATLRDASRSSSTATTTAMTTGLAAAAAVRCCSPTASPAVVFINSPLMARAFATGRPTFGRMDPALERVHIALMSRTGNKYLNMNSSTMPDKIFTGSLICLTMLAIIALFWYQNFGPGFVFKHVAKT